MTLDSPYVACLWDEFDMWMSSSSKKPLELGHVQPNIYPAVEDKAAWQCLVLSRRHDAVPFGRTVELANGVLPVYGSRKPPEMLPLL